MGMSEWLWNDFHWWKVSIIFVVGAAAVLLLWRLNRRKV